MFVLVFPVRDGSQWGSAALAVGGVKRKQGRLFPSALWWFDIVSSVAFAVGDVPALRCLSSRNQRCGHFLSQTGQWGWEGVGST